MSKKESMSAVEWYQSSLGERVRAFIKNLLFVLKVKEFNKSN